MEDELAERYNKLDSEAFHAAFDKAAPQWLSRDCHRSQYGYPFRVGIQLALENRHRSITFASFSCSGADIANGLFLDMDAREGTSEPAGAKVRAQLDQLSDLLCRGGAAARSQQVTYVLPMFSQGSTNVSAQRVTKSWCPPSQRKRPIDVVLMSIGGNDVGFGGLVAYSLTESASDLAPIAGWIGSQIRYSPQVSRVYFESRAQAYAEFQRLYTCSAQVSPTTIPPSYRLVLRTVTRPQRDDLVRTISRLPAVRSVSCDPSSPCVDVASGH